MSIIKQRRLHMGKKRLARILNNSGESLIYVMAVMFFLIVISISVTAAAMTTARYVGAHREYNQIMVLSDSIHRNIMFSLQDDPTDIGRLAWSLTDALYEANSCDILCNNPCLLTHRFTNPITLDIVIPTVDLDDYNVDFEVMLSFPVESQHVFSHNAVPALFEMNQIPINCAACCSLIYPFPFVCPILCLVNPSHICGGMDPCVEHHECENPAACDVEGIGIEAGVKIEESFVAPRIPRTATLFATLDVIVRITFGDKTITTIATYEFSGAALSEDPDDDHFDKKESEVTPLNLAMQFTNFGEWRLMQYEILE
jgi:hypothetical protein